MGRQAARTLQKYYSLEGVRKQWLRDILCDGKLYLSNYHELDDETEFSPKLEYKIFGSVDLFPRWMRFLQGLFIGLSWLRPNSKKRQRMRRYGGIEAVLNCPAQQRLMLWRLKRHAKEHVRIFSFSDSVTRNVEELWCKYANGHRGVRIDFDHNQIAAACAGDVRLESVTYSDERRVAFIDLLDEDSILEKFVRPTFLTKDAKHSAQREVRLLRLVGVQSPYYPKRLPPYVHVPISSIVQIVVGKYISEADEKFVRDLAANLHRPVQVTQEGFEQYVLIGRN